jgi:hypothetical protein
MTSAGHVAPEVAARPATVDEIPRMARALAACAREHDWTVLVTYARGTTLPTRSQPCGMVVESIAVRMARASEAAAAVWIDGRFCSAMTPFHSYTLSGLRHWIEES